MRERGCAGVMRRRRRDVRVTGVYVREPMRDVCESAYMGAGFVNDLFMSPLPPRS